MRGVVGGVWWLCGHRLTRLPYLSLITLQVLAWVWACRWWPAA